MQGMASESILLAQTHGIVESQKQMGRTGTVVAIGPGRRNTKGVRQPMDINIGERVSWGEFDFPAYHEDGKTYAVIQQADITSVIEQAKAA
jgi:chaperonin GroES